MGRENHGDTATQIIAQLERSNGKWVDKNDGWERNLHQKAQWLHILHSQVERCKWFQNIVVTLVKEWLIPWQVSPSFPINGPSSLVEQQVQD